MKGIIVILALCAIIGLLAGSCAGQLLSDGTRNTARTSCVGLVNIGSCNITQSRDTTPDTGVFVLLGALGVGCLALGAVWPKGAK